MRHQDKTLQDWAEVGLRGAAVVVGLGSLSYFFYLVKEIDKALGPWPEEDLRQRLNAGADELESILMSRGNRARISGKRH